MAKLDWMQALDDLVKSGGGAWPPSTTALKDQALALAKKWLSDEAPEVASVLQSALDDGDLDKTEAIALIVAMVSTWGAKTPFGSAYTQQLLEMLKDGELTLSEVAAGAAGWIAHRSDNKNVQFFVREIADGKLSRDDVQDLLLELVRQRKGDQAANAVKALLTGKVLLSEVLLLVAALRLGATPADPGSTTDELLRTLESYLNDTTSAAVDDALDRVIAKDYSGLAAVMIATAVKGEDLALLLRKEVVQQLRKRVMAAMKKELLTSVQGLQDAQADALSVAIVELMTGKRSLWPEKTEKEAFLAHHYPEQMFPVWTRVRRVLYAAKWATENNALVPTEALARPHVFAAAEIQPETKLKTLVSTAKARVFVECVKRFCAVEFADDPTGAALQNPNNYPVSTDAIASGAPASRVLLFVWVALN